MKRILLMLLFALSLFANSDLIEIKQNIKLILNKVNTLEKKVDLLDKKVNELDKKVEINSIKIEMLQKQMDKRFEAIDKRFESIDKRFEMLQKNMDERFEAMNKRFEDMNKRFEDVNKRFEDMINYLWMISAAFLGLVGVTIGFAIWDRKSMIKAAKEEIIEDIKNNRLKEFVYKLRELAATDKELAKVLREFHMI